MARLNLVQGCLGLVVLIFAAGCSREEDLSPDGKTVVSVNSDSVVFHDASGKQPNVAISVDDPGSPRFSSDGSSIRFTSGSFGPSFMTTRERIISLNATSVSKRPTYPSKLRQLSWPERPR